MILSTSAVWFRAVIFVCLHIGALLCPQGLAAQSSLSRPTVNSLKPDPGLVGAPATTDISITFDDTLDVSSVTDSTFRVFGRWSGPMTGKLLTEDLGQTIRFVPDGPFFAGEFVLVSMSSRIKMSDGRPLERGYSWGFWVESSRASLDLRESATVPIRQPNEGLIQSYGAYAGDFNDDGWSDLAIPNERAGDVRVFLNSQGSFGPFEVYPLAGGSVPSPNEGGDFNRDGYLDIAVGSAASENIHVLLGDGTGALTVSPPIVSVGTVRGLCLMDVDTDGDEDIVTASRAADNVYIHLNNGDATFGRPISVDGGGDGETSCAVGDANGDGILDLFVGSFDSEVVSVLLGDGNGNLFFSARVTVDGPPWMLAAGDLNGDGFADVVSANSTGNSASVVLSDGIGRLRASVSHPGGAFPLAVDLGDIDGDGDLDVVTSNFSSADFTVFENDGSGSLMAFADYPAERAGSCAILHDRDNDGDLDLTGVDELRDVLILYETQSVSVGVDESPRPDGHTLEAFPNPARDQVTLEISIREPAYTEVFVYDLLGRVTATPVSEFLSAGDHQVKLNAAGLAPGLYIAEARIGTRRTVRRFVLTD